MKKIIIFMCFSVFLAAGLEIDSKDIDRKNGKLYYKDVVLNGEYTIVFDKPSKLKWDSMFNDLSIEYEIYKVSNIFKNGKEAGETRAYGKDNELLIVNNKKEGKFLIKEFYYEGNLVEKLSRDDVNFLDSFFLNRTGAVLMGPYELYYKNGKIKEKGSFSIAKLSIPDYIIKTSRKNGEIKRYYENGSLKEIILFKDGLRNGNSNYYDEDGNLLKTEKYIKGIKQ